jgi:hypothetical protein
MPRPSPSGRDSARRSFCSPLSTAEFIFSPEPPRYRDRALLLIGFAADGRCSKPAAACYCRPW